MFQGLSLTKGLSLTTMKRLSVIMVLGVTIAWAPGAVIAEEEPLLAGLRRAMVAEIRGNAMMFSAEIGKTNLDERVVAAMGKVPRHEFVAEDLRLLAYVNRPLPIGHGQTISQPYVVAVMTDLIEPRKDAVVLEIGTGSGYQAAVLAKLVSKVCTIEIIPELGKEAEKRLKTLGYTNVVARIGDGYYGWKEHAPFDAIVVTAAAGQIPPPLLQQLKPGGRMIIPVGGPFFVQHLILVEKKADGTYTTRQLMPVAFVPFTGEH